MRVARVREVARVSVLGRNREDVAARREQRALALGAQPEGLDLPRGRHARRPRVQAVVGHRDVNLPILSGLRVVDRQLAGHLVHDPAGLRVRARPAHVPRLAVRELRDGAGRDVVRIQVERPVLVRVVVDLVADPHRVALGAGTLADRLRRIAGEVENGEIVRLAAGVALLGAEIAEDLRVDDAFAVGRVGTRSGERHRQRHRRSTLGAHRVEPRLAERPRGALAAEEDARTVLRPTVDLIVVSPALGARPAGRVPGQLLRNAAARRHDVDLLVAVVLAGEGDRFAVGRELGEHLDARMRRESRRLAAAHVGEPDVPAVREGDLVAVDVGKTKKLRLRGGRGQRGGDDGGRSQPNREVGSHANKRADRAASPQAASLLGNRVGRRRGGLPSHPSECPYCTWPTASLSRARSSAVLVPRASC